MPERNEPSKAMQFFEEKGFYIVLALCAAAIGIAGYLLFAATEEAAPVPPDYDPGLAAMSSAAADLPVFDTGDADAPAVSLQKERPAVTTAATTKAAMTMQTVPKTTAASAAVTTAAKTTAVKTTAAQKKKSFFVKPVAGEVYQPFSGDELVYDRTNGDWRTHNGVDFLCDDGAKVMVIADGVVKDLYTDDYYGASILVEHENGLSSVYTGLMTETAIYEGQALQAGDVIGAVDADALFEASLPVHFHLEVMRDGVRIDPMEVLEG